MFKSFFVFIITVNFLSACVTQKNSGINYSDTGNTSTNNMQAQAGLMLQFTCTFIRSNKHLDFNL